MVGYSMGYAWVIMLGPEKGVPAWTQTNTCVGIFGVLNL